MELYKLPQKYSGSDYIGVEGLKAKDGLDTEYVIQAVDAINREGNVCLQVCDANFVCGPKHVFHAATLALKAHEEKRGRANKMEVEIILYLSGKRQINEAISGVGITKKTREIAAMAAGDKKDVQRTLERLTDRLKATTDDRVLELTVRKRQLLQRLFEISDRELEIVTRGGKWETALLKLSMERGAMLDAFKK